MNRVGIVAAFPGELKPLVRGWRRLTLSGGRAGDAGWQGRVGPAECIAVSAGMGKEAAVRACHLAEQEGELNALVSLGWAGALSCGVHPGEAYVIAQVLDAGTSERFATAELPGALPGSPTPLTLVTIDRVAESGEKRQLAGSYRAVLADMEAAVVARQAQERGIPFYCFKAVSDAYGEALPDFNRYTDAQGKLRMCGLLTHVAARPKYWRPMARMGKNGKIGAEVLAQAVQGFLREFPDGAKDAGHR